MLDAGHMTSLAIKQLVAVRKIQEYFVEHESKRNICLSIFLDHERTRRSILESLSNMEYAEMIL